MIPLADFVAFSTSVSNHSSRKSLALMVMSLYSALNFTAPSPRMCLPSLSMPMRSRGLSDAGSGGTIEMIGFTARAMWNISWPYSSYASASLLRVPQQLAPRVVVVGPLREIVAVEHRRHGALERQDVQAVARQIEIADDLGPQQAHHVREHREGEAREDLPAHRGAAHLVGLLEHEHALAGAREVGRVHQSVVPAADDDRVVPLHGRHAFFLGGSKNGRRHRLRGRALANVLHRDLHLQRRARNEVRRAHVRERDVLLEQRAPAPAGRVADLRAARVHRHARAPRRVRQTRRQSRLGVQSFERIPIHFDAGETPLGSARDFRRQRVLAHEPGLLEIHAPREVELEGRRFLRLDHRAMR